MDKLFTLLDLQKQARQSETIEKLAFIAVNKSIELIPYKQAIFWEKSDFSFNLHTISGNQELDKQGPYAQWMKRAIQFFLKVPQKPEFENVITIATKDLLDDWHEWTREYAVLLLFRNKKGDVKAGLWLEREASFLDAELTLLDELADAYGHAYRLIKNMRSKSTEDGFFQSKKFRIAALITFIALAFFPVRLTITAPAEIVAQNSRTVTIPFDGTLEGITVNPGENIKAQDVIAVMDKISLQGKVDLAKESYNAAQQAYSRAIRESLSSPDKKAEFNYLQAQVNAKKIEYDYAKELLQRSDIIAPISGLAVFSDKNTYNNRPVRTGDKIMQIANPKSIELLIRVPVNAMLPIKENIPARFYLNIAPLKNHTAAIQSIGYQASPDPDGLLTYKISATLNSNEEDFRIGWKGTSKIYGEWSVLSYAILRRPLIALRQFLGL